MTSADDRQPVGYVERKEVTVQRFPDADASPPRGIGGSGAGSTVELDLSDFAQHVVTSEWLAEVKSKFTRLQMDLTQSRATEAELRAKVERQPSVIRLAEDIIGGHSGHLPGASSSCPRCQWDAGLAALDVAEQPARAEEGPQQPAEETR